MKLLAQNLVVAAEAAEAAAAAEAAVVVACHDLAVWMLEMTEAYQNASQETGSQNH